MNEFRTNLAIKRLNGLHIVRCRFGCSFLAEWEYLGGFNRLHSPVWRAHVPKLVVVVGGEMEETLRNMADQDRNDTPAQGRYDF